MARPHSVQLLLVYTVNRPLALIEEAVSVQPQHSAELINTRTTVADHTMTHSTACEDSQCFRTDTASGTQPETRPQLRCSGTNSTQGLHKL